MEEQEIGGATWAVICNVRLHNEDAHKSTRRNSKRRRTLDGPAFQKRPRTFGLKIVTVRRSKNDSMEQGPKSRLHRPSSFNESYKQPPVELSCESRTRLQIAGSW